jgi:hypothetical protein
MSRKYSFRKKRWSRLRVCVCALAVMDASAFAHAGPFTSESWTEGHAAFRAAFYAPARKLHNGVPESCKLNGTRSRSAKAQSDAPFDPHLGVVALPTWSARKCVCSGCPTAGGRRDSRTAGSVNAPRRNRVTPSRLARLTRGHRACQRGE